MTPSSPPTPNRLRHSERPASTNCSLRPDLAAFFVLGSRKFAHVGQHHEYGVLAELRAHFGTD